MGFWSLEFGPTLHVIVHLHQTGTNKDLLGCWPTSQSHNLQNTVHKCMNRLYKVRTHLMEFETNPCATKLLSSIDSITSNGDFVSPRSEIL
jgi:hypothetical protein